MKKGYLKKIIKLLIVIIIPLAAGLVTGSYAYKRYQPRFFNFYMNDASQEDTEDRLVSYLKFQNQGLEYEEKEDGYKFYFTENVKKDDKDLFTFSIIRGSRVVNEAYYNKVGTYLGKKDFYYITYYIAVYNVNYEALANVLDATGEHKLLHTELPKISVEIVSKKDETRVAEDGKTDDDVKSKTIELSTVASVTAESNPTVIYDYGYSPKLDSKGDKLNANNPTSMRYYELPLTDLEGFNKELAFNVKVNSNWAGDDQVTEDVAKFEFTDMYNKEDLNKDANVAKEIVDGFNKGYDKDIFAAGYTKFAFGHYIWWEALIAIVLFEVVCASFVLVWNSEDEKENKNKQKATK